MATGRAMKACRIRVARGRPFRTAMLLLLPLVFLLGAMSCTTPPKRGYARDGKEYGVTRGLFRHRWWNYQERGISFAEGSFFEEAINDFQEAIGQRKDDQWRARTYGMHFVDYFPHRELGIVYYRLGRYEDAIGELETSLASAESAKAKFFLNKARSERLQQTGLDRTFPVVSISEPAEGLVTNAFNVTIRGMTEDDTFVSRVRVNGKALPFELSEPRLPFEVELPLEEGSNPFTIVAEDLLGNTTEAVVRVTADRRGPVITVADIRPGGKGFVIDGSVADDSGVASCTVNGRPVALDSPTQTTFSVGIAGDTIRIEARDIAGNITVAEMPASREALYGPALPIVAAAAPVAVRLRDRGMASGAPFSLPDLYALNVGGLLDTTPPSIEIKELAQSQEVFEDRVLVEGDVTDESTIKALSFNGRPILRASGKRVFFSQLIGLEVGGNVVEIEARDTLGNQGRKTVSILRKEQKVHQLGSRMSLALLPLQHEGESSAIGSAVYDAFLSAVVNQGRFDLVERTKVEDVLRELKLSATDLVDPDTAAKAGRLVAAEGLVAGTVVETGTAIEVIARLIDTETSLVLASNDVFDEDKSLRAIVGLMDRLAFKFKRDFPVVEGLVIEAKNGEIMIDLGKDHGLRKNVRLIVFREGEPVRHPVTGKILGADTDELGEAKTSAVFDEFSKAEVIRKEGGMNVMDRVITK